jgi:thiol-disulfide isomerase/thioredoxin
MHLKVGSEADAINLSKIINDGDWMVLYYAEWCGHCNDMKPEWQKVVSNFNNKKTNSNKINIAEIESKHIDKMPNKPSIEGFPSIKMYNDGKEVANFEDSQRIASKIQEFANRNSTKEKHSNHMSHNKMEFKLNNVADEKNSVISNRNIPNMDNLLRTINTNMKSASKKNTIRSHKSETPKIRIIDLPCTSIRYAKACKRNPKCMYDGSVLKCVDKPVIKNINSKLMSIKSKKSSVHRTPSKSRKTMANPAGKPRSKSGNKSKSDKNTFNVRKTTKSVFDQLIKSFGRIGTEAEKDSKLLKSASNKLA